MTETFWGGVGGGDSGRLGVCQFGEFPPANIIKAKVTKRAHTFKNYPHSYNIMQLLYE